MDCWKVIKTKARKATALAGIGAVGLGVTAALEVKNLQDLLDHQTRTEFAATQTYSLGPNSTSETGMDVGQSAAKAGEFLKVYKLETTSRLK